jgi:beta-glucosidase
MNKKIISIIIVSFLYSGSVWAKNAKFLWGASSSAFQMEGSAYEDGKGRSIWDYYLDDKNLAGPGVSGRVSINFYDRTQYLKDIALLKSMHINSYRFSISWPRIIPDGLGPVNLVAIHHYRQFIIDLKAAGIEPLVTLYHWDMPISLASAGGWKNRQSIDWFRKYSEVIFENFSDLVNTYVLVNEPSVELATNTMAEEKLQGKNPGNLPPIIPDVQHIGNALTTFNHILLASAAAKDSFDKHSYQGQLGIALPLFPTLTDVNANAEDKFNASITDGILNRWFLDAMYKGKYPADIINFIEKNKIIVDITPQDAETIKKANFDFLGINYYAPFFIKHDDSSKYKYAPKIFIPKGEKIEINGAVRPEQFKKLLIHIKNEYNNPQIIITENGAGFPGEDKLINNKVNDSSRCEYIVSHIAAMNDAISKGVRVTGYHVWSSHDNIEWLSGYQSRFGLIYVDYNTQKRTPKLSSYIYRRIIDAEHVKVSDCYK